MKLLEEEKIYFKKRDRALYKAATKEEIYNILDIYDFDMIKTFLEYMDYPWFPNKWIDLITTYGETPEVLAKYISLCCSKTVLLIGYKDSAFIPRAIKKSMVEKTRKRMDPDYYGD